MNTQQDICCCCPLRSNVCLCQLPLCSKLCCLSVQASFNWGGFLTAMGSNLTFQVGLADGYCMCMGYARVNFANAVQQ